MQLSVTGNFVVKNRPDRRIWRRILRALRWSPDPLKAAQKRADLERLSPHLQRDMGLIPDATNDRTHPPQPIGRLSAGHLLFL